MCSNAELSKILDKLLERLAAVSWTNAYTVKQVGSFLKKIRRERGYTQDEFAEIVGVSHATLSALENGKSVSTKTLERALQFLGLRLVILPKNAEVVVGDPSGRISHEI